MEYPVKLRVHILISQPKQMLWVLEHPKHILTIMGKKVCNFTLKFLVYVNLCTMLVYFILFLKEALPT